MIQNQFGRRNLDNYTRSGLSLMLEEFFKEKAKENKVIAMETARQANPNNKDEQFCQISDKTVELVDTKKELAKIAGVSHDTIYKVKENQGTRTDILQKSAKSLEAVDTR